jgi:TolA-binding protein
MHELIRAYWSQEDKWDDLREQRIFAAVMKRLGSQSRKRTNYSILCGVSVAAAVVIAVVIGVLFNIRQSQEEALEQAARVPVNPADIKSDKTKNDSVLTLADVGQVTVSLGADVSILEHRADAVYLEQTEGRALYNIVHREGRTVQVRVAGIVVVVVGTVFWVTVEKPVVRIEVNKGVVQVDDGNQVVTLEAHETLSVGIPERKKQEMHLADDREEGRKKAVHQARKTEDLFSEADQARKTGDLRKAVKILRRIVSRKESRYSVASAEFLLGKVERKRGNHFRAAEAFYSCSRQAPNRALKEDALAEAALSFHAAGNIKKARIIAKTYLESYPEGIYIAKIKRLIE